ncbi:M15 family metallopeptidase [Nesterenkonia natronophila]|uniref:D-alanyl-D-alanine carboxypeptidase family protein n=1 Tax=Nesterenkonia natronophila TaxID=2174932 RepID=A0A3A4F949_9MICC|nr:M15 family metallopeptidase [Nesterenkonia natronophila]RJN31727.1 D-alanyl-D-alanine carboxypeptidase family protein [Nesterenkonia natronophila]
MRILTVGASLMLLMVGSACADGEDSSESQDAAPAESPAAEDKDTEDAESELDQSSDSEDHDDIPESSEHEPVSQASADPDSVHILVNKQNPLDPLDYEPDDLREVDAPREFSEAPLRDEAAEAYEELHAAAAGDNIDLWVTTAYRDFDFQQSLYEQRFYEDGAAAADRVSARPGFSEHQTGLAVDVADLEDRECYLRACFGESEQGQWLSEHSAEFGFVIRYPEGAEEITGFQYEPWHLRYVGQETARDVFQRGLTLEEYWDEPPAPGYDQEYQPSREE